MNMGSVNFISGNRSVGLNQFHFEWCSKYRKPVLKNIHAQEIIEDSLIRTAQLYKVVIHNLHVDVDHIHLFVSLPFNMSVSRGISALQRKKCKRDF